jgi:phospho-N-acetylmuramoyl-pentapeptide-transferase
VFYHLLYPLSEQYSFFNIFRYLTFRSAVAFIVATIFSIIFGKYFINYMSKRQFGQIIRTEGPESHLKKGGTPTMGGVFLVGAILLAALACGNLQNISTIAFLVILFSYFLLGFLDDYLKVLKKNTDGVSGRFKLLWQFFVSIIVMYFLVSSGEFDTNLYIPFYKEALFDLNFLYVPFGAFVIVGSSNAVNLTDGLDGLAIGPIITSALTLALFAYLAGHRDFSEYLYLPYVAHAGELSVMMSAIIGAGVGFLWYNSYPAQVFMGDVGSLSLGGAIGIASILTKNEILLIIFGGVFVVEALSVIIQVVSFKTRGKRVFLMAPIHHHFELKGWAEPKVIVRFWIVSLLLAIASIATLKIR